MKFCAQVARWLSSCALTPGQGRACWAAGVACPRVIFCFCCTGKKTPGGAGTHTGTGMCWLMCFCIYMYPPWTRVGPRIRGARRKTGGMRKTDLQCLESPPHLVHDGSGHFPQNLSHVACTTPGSIRIHTSRYGQTTCARHHFASLLTAFEAAGSSAERPPSSARSYAQLSSWATFPLIFATRTAPHPVSFPSFCLSLRTSMLMLRL